MDRREHSVSQKKGRSLSDAHLDHHDGLDRLVVAVLLHLADLVDDVGAGDDAAEHGVLRRRRAVEPVEELVVDRVDEELRAARVRLAGVGHRDGVRQVRVLRDVLVRDVAAGVALDRLAVERLERRAALGAAGARGGRLGVARVGAAELAHEAVDHAVEREAVVEARLNEVDEVAAGDRQVVEQLDAEAAEGGLAVDNLGHGGEKGAGNTGGFQ
mmetsp:Transcript_4166/g.13257  ORF Transcript_4166/g.13257 Transcript_4166/m.13257 type:complete len:214 (-) Transcript_4166:22-663(-)|eukprot:CAMPEP_0174826938 /NCGR_PEP_ID=MMETSP1114-20130205/340_1 /TAXON_ID=312471 /ORGANISM="Neobodo designis, Strain CCAP 1951/1" /LENGTH=213 /DNA_ID=CAMNT_0016060513 /DNA_START=158 /DNA_END=799 /DNA_ORIENTATION=-